MKRLITIYVHGKEMQVKSGVSLREIADGKPECCKNSILVAKVNNDLMELHRKVKESCSVEFMDLTGVEGFRVYQRSVVFLMLYAAREIMGPDVRIVVEHSINKNYYCEVDGMEPEKDLLSQVEDKMKEAVKADLPIEKFSMPIEEGIRLSMELGLNDKAQTLKYRRTSNVNFYKLGSFYDYFYGPMANSAGALQHFKLVKENKGFMLVFPMREQPDKLIEVKKLKKITQVFNESNHWVKILKTDTVGALNDIICGGGRGDIVRVNEALHEKKIANIADKIYQSNKKITLIAGPSSSGKTTFANRLCVQLRVNGLRPHVISLDDYYVNRENTPRDEFGEYDFESLDAIDIMQFNGDLQDLLQGKRVQLPHFNFVTGLREYKGRFMELAKDDVLVIEGIHGLNDKLSASVPKDYIFKIFISALTQINLDDHNRIPTSDTRMIRRMVRDSQFRSFDAKKTIAMWGSVTRGEQKNIFPFQEDADAVFNSALVYEMSVLKQYAEPLLFSITRDEPEYTEAKRLVKFLDCFIGIPASDVPNNSILREFIGGSCFKV